MCAKSNCLVNTVKEARCGLKISWETQPKLGTFFYQNEESKLSEFTKV